MSMEGRVQAKAEPPWEQPENLQDLLVKVELESQESECGASAYTRLYREHEVKEELVVGPEVFHQPVVLSSGQKQCGEKRRHDTKSFNDKKTRKKNKRKRKNAYTSKKNKWSKNYTPETLKNALEEINTGRISVYKAGKVYKIPHQTLYDRIHSKHTKRDTPGSPTVLTKNEEVSIVNWIMVMDRIGFPVTKDLLLYSVQKIVKNLDRVNKFKDGVPGRHWYEGFCKRNPIISQKICKPLSTSRTGATEEYIRAWFQRVHQYFQDNDLLDILEDPTRVFNCDESIFFLNRRGKAVLSKTGTKSKYDDKECLNLLLGASADGNLMPLLALFPYKRIPSKILKQYPSDWAIVKSETGRMTCDNFYEYVTNVFHPFLIRNEIKKPVALFLDGHVSYLSLHLAEYCKENGIILVALLPSSKHPLQPMDVAVIHSLKNAWSKDVDAWRMENDGARLKREDFAPVLDKTIKNNLKTETIVNGFRECGIHPFNENAVDYSRLITSATPLTNSGTSSPVQENQVSNDALTQLEIYLGYLKVREFEECNGVWGGDVRDENLYYYWKNLKETSGAHDSHLLNDQFGFGDTKIEANGDFIKTLDPLADEPIDIALPGNSDTNAVYSSTSNTLQKEPRNIETVVSPAIEMESEKADIACSSDYTFNNIVNDSTLVQSPTKLPEPMEISPICR